MCLSYSNALCSIMLCEALIPLTPAPRSRRRHHLTRVASSSTDIVAKAMGPNADRAIQLLRDAADDLESREAYVFSQPGKRQRKAGLPSRSVTTSQHATASGLCGVRPEWRARRHRRKRKSRPSWPGPTPAPGPMPAPGPCPHQAVRRQPASGPYAARRLALSARCRQAACGGRRPVEQAACKAGSGRVGAALWRYWSSVTHEARGRHRRAPRRAPPRVPEPVPG